jgi:hypothetical protein
VTENMGGVTLRKHATYNRRAQHEAAVELNIEEMRPSPLNSVCCTCLLLNFPPYQNHGSSRSDIRNRLPRGCRIWFISMFPQSSALNTFSLAVTLFREDFN